VPAVDRYQRFAPLYDLFACEAVYRPGRLRGVADLHLLPGETVVDAGCGTGLNFAALETALGPGGTIVGIDASPAMLDRARRRVRRHRWGNVHLLQADLTSAGADELRALVLDTVPQVDAILATYSLSVAQDPEAAWQRLLRLHGPRPRQP
jgi:demethylmenaquinone methyltransferase/2-methoxy-6-polyprenyl-1,4-benzoquinol methylase